MKIIRTFCVMVVAYYSTTGLCEVISRWKEWRHERRMYRDFHKNFSGASPYRNFSEIEELNGIVNGIRALPEINQVQLIKTKERA